MHSKRPGYSSGTAATRWQESENGLCSELMKTQISHAKSTQENDNVRSVYAVQLPRGVPAFLGEEAERDIPYDPEPVGRYNVAPGTRVLLLSERRSQLHLDPVHWGYAPEWWNKPALINARSETAAGSRMFRPLWEHGRAIVLLTAGLSGNSKTA